MKWKKFIQQLFNQCKVMLIITVITVAPQNDIWPRNTYRKNAVAVDRTKIIFPIN